MYHIGASPQEDTIIGKIQDLSYLPHVYGLCLFEGIKYEI